MSTIAKTEIIDMTDSPEEIAIPFTRDREGYAIFEVECPVCGDEMHVHYLDADEAVCECGEGAVEFRWA